MVCLDSILTSDRLLRNNMVSILDRHDGTLVGSFGGNGRYAGQLHGIDSIAMDSKGNLCTGEVEDGKRVQKFVPTNRGKQVDQAPQVTGSDGLTTS
jgi:sugar lactone lactonase YvrE